MSDLNESEKARILSRLKKLLAMANDSGGASEQERETAMRMAHSLMAKYNMTMAEAEASGAKSDEPRTGSPLEMKDYPWMTICARALADLFFCHHFQSRSGSAGKLKHYFVGKESNVYTAQKMTKYIISSIDREGMKMARSSGADSISNYWRSFCKGAAHQVRLRCEKLRAEAEAASSTAKTPGTALVLASLYATEDRANVLFIEDKMGVKLKSVNTTMRNTSAHAAAAGRAYGDKIGLNRQIGGGSSNSNKRIK